MLAVAALALGCASTAPAELAPELGTDTSALEALDLLSREAISLESSVAGTEKRLEDFVADPFSAAPDNALDGERITATGRSLAHDRDLESFKFAARTEELELDLAPDLALKQAAALE